MAKVNTDLVNKVVNLASRTAKVRGADRPLAKVSRRWRPVRRSGQRPATKFAHAYEACDYGQAMRLVIGLADRANPYVENNKPWELRKDAARARELQDVCTVALNLFRQIVLYLSPVLPRLAQQAGELLGKPIQHWDESKTPLVGTPVGKFTHMLQRVEEKDVLAMIEETKNSGQTASPAVASAPEPRS